MTTNSSDVGVFRDSVRAATRFAYRNSLALILISVAWFLAALPILTLGPATLCAYRAVIELREHDRLEVRPILGMVRTQFVHAFLFGLAPLAFWGIALFYAIQYALLSETPALLLFLAAFYIGTYLAILAVPVLIGLAHGLHVLDAISFGRAWVSDHVTLALLVALGTLVITMVCVILSIAFPMLFAGLAACFHVELLDDAYETWATEDPPTAERSPTTTNPSL